MELPTFTAIQISPYGIIVPDLVDVTLGFLPEDLLGFAVYQKCAHYEYI